MNAKVTIMKFNYSDLEVKISSSDYGLLNVTLTHKPTGITRSAISCSKRLRDKLRDEIIKEVEAESNYQKFLRLKGIQPKEGGR